MNLPLQTLSQLSPLACKLYLLLQSLADGRRVTVTQQVLARHAHLSRRACQIALAQLRAARLLYQLPRLPRTPSSYVLLTPKAHAAAPHPTASSPTIPTRTARNPLSPQAKPLLSLAPSKEHPRAPHLSPPAAHPHAPHFSLSDAHLPAPHTSSDDIDISPSVPYASTLALAQANPDFQSILSRLPADTHQLMLFLGQLPPNLARLIHDSLPPDTRAALLAHAQATLAADLQPATATPPA